MQLRVKRRRLPHAAAWLTGMVCGAALLLSACGTVRPPVAPTLEADARPVAQAAPASRPSTAPGKLALPPAGSGRGGYYLDDGPGDAPPPNLEAIPNAEPKVEPYSTRGNKPYVVFGKTYTPVTDNQPMKQRGVGSWYGKKFHGQKTSSGELYDMYKMTAAHPTLPIPSYARVTNLKNGAQVIVRVNDRGPFHSSRIIDLSYTAALKLGYIGHGSTDLEVERLLPDEIARINAQGRNPPTVATVATAATAAITPITTAAATGPRTLVAANARAVAPFVTAIQTTQAAAADAPDSVSLDDFLKMQPVDSGAMPVSMTTLSGPVSAATAVLADASIQSTETGPALAAGFYLQFGAYSRSANADQLRQQLLQRWPAGVPLPEVRQSGALYRLFSGPFANREAALLAASQVGENPLARPVIVTR